MKLGVFKYEIPKPDAAGRSTVTLPRGAQILDVAMNGDRMVFWAMEDPMSPDFEEREFLLLNTGESADIFNHDWRYLWRYLGTVVHRAPCDVDPVVWHVFSKGGSR